jgi:hypothetical protein
MDYGLENPHTYDQVTYYMKERKDLNYLEQTPVELKKILKEKQLFLEGWRSFEGSPMTGRMNLKPEQHILDHYK